MTKWAGYLLIAISALHMLVLGTDALPQLGHWLGGGLWTLAHWAPATGQDPALVLSGMAFWSTIGSFALPIAVFGALLVWLGRRAITPPAFVGWGLFAWVLLTSLIIQPSGFPLGLIPAALLILAARRRSGAAD